MITTRIAGQAKYGSGYGLGAGRMSYGAGYGDYGDVVNVSGRRRGTRRPGWLGEVIRWAPLGPGGDPQMSLQGLGLIPTTMAEVDWYQVGLGAVLGIGAFMVAKKQKWIK